MAYKTRPGVVMIQVCGQHILVATRPVWAQFPRVRPIPPKWAVCWALMENDRTSEEAIHAFVELFHKSEQEVRSRFDKIFRNLSDEGYLTEVEEIKHDGC